jgi:tetratricopeptide (TPR) repeat protein
MLLGLLCAMAGIVLIFVGPKNSSGYVPWWCYAVVALGVLLWLTGQGQTRAQASRLAHERNIESGRAAIEAAVAAGDENAEARAHFDLAVAYQSSYQPPRSNQTPDYAPLEDAAGHLLSAIRLYRRLGQLDGEGLALSNLGIVCYGRHEDLAALKHWNDALDIAKKLAFPDWEYQTIQRLSRLLGEMGRLSEANEVMKEYSIRRATKR